MSYILPSKRITLSHATNTEVTFNYNGSFHTMRIKAVENLVRAVNKHFDKHGFMSNILRAAKNLGHRCVCDFAQECGFSNQGQLYMVLRYLANDGTLYKDGHAYWEADEVEDFIPESMEEIWTAQQKSRTRRKRVA